MSLYIPQGMLSLSGIESRTWNLMDSLNLAKFKGTISQEKKRAMAPCAFVMHTTFINVMLS